MKLDHIFEGAGTRLFSGTDRDGTTFSLVLKRVGADGSSNHLWYGRMKQLGETSFEASLVVTPNGDVIAVNTVAPMAAVEKAFVLKRKGYGRSLVPSLSWEVTRYQGMKLEGYNEAG